MKAIIISFSLLLITLSSYSQQPYILVGETYSAKVSKIDPVTNSKIASVKVADSVGVPVPNVGKMVLDTIHNWAYITNNTGNAISVIDLNTWSATYPPVNIPGIKAPKGLAINKTADTLYVCNDGADGIQDATDPLSIVKITGNTFPPTLSLVTSVPCGKQPTNVVLSHDGKYAVVSCRNQARLAVVDLTSNSVAYNYNYPNTTYEPEGIDIHPTQNIFYCTTHGMNTIDILSTVSMSVLSSVSITYTGVPPQPSGGVFSPNGNLFLISAQTSGKMYLFNSSNPLNPIQLPPVISSGGVQPHQAVFLNDTIAYVPNTNNTQPVGNISIIKTYPTPSNLGLVSGTWNGPLSMVLVKTTTNTSIQSYNTEKENIQFYPNPFSSITILQTNKVFKDATLTVYNSRGQTVKQIKNISGQAVNLHRDNLPNGLYFIHLTQDSKTFLRNKLVITDN